MTTISRLQTNARMSKIVRLGELVFLGGQTANRSPSATQDVTAQTREVLSRVDALLVEAGSDRAHVLSTTIYLRDMQDFDAMNAVWEAWLPAGHGPARTTVQASLSSSNLLVEMTVIAAVKSA